MTDTTANTNPAVPADIPEEFEAAASFAQQRLWFLDQLEPDSSLYNISVAWRLRGPLSSRALQAALDRLAERHETLRTRFDQAGGVPVQVISDYRRIELCEVPAEPDLLPQIGRLARRPFDLRTGPLLRATLLCLRQDEHALLLTVHHSIADAWSLNILCRELAVAYAAALDGRAPEFPELPVQYADFAEWQQAWLSGEELRRQLEFWRQHLHDAPQALALPTDRPRPRIQTYTGASRERSLPGEVATALQELAQTEGCTLFHCYLAAFGVLLGRWSAADDLVIGTPIAGRQRPELEGLVGFFVNTLALRLRLDDDPDFRTLLHRVRDLSLDAFAHQDLPFEKLVEQLQPERSTSCSPLFQVLFVLQHAGNDAFTPRGLSVDPLRVDTATAKFDLTLFVTARTGGASLLFEYNTDLFEAATIDRALAHLERLLTEIATSPERAVSRLPLLAAPAAQRMLTGFNPPAQPRPVLQAQQRLERQAERTPQATAVRLDALSSLSYRELNERANALAEALLKRGAAPGMRIALCMQPSLELAVAVLGVLKTGAACVPLDADAPTRRLARLLKAAAPLLTVTSRLPGKRLPKQAPRLCMDDPLPTVSDRGNPDARGEVAYVMYTSGSTGEPKGVVQRHASLSNLLDWQRTQPGLAAPARTLQFASLSFDVSFQELFTTWDQGGCLVVVDAATRRDFPALAKLIAAAGVERLYLPCAALQPLADALLSEHSALAVRDIVVAGEQLQITSNVRALFTKLHDARLHNHYGPTETHVVAAHTLEGNPQAWPTLPPIGRPVSNTRAYVLDRHRQPVPVGLPGELYLGGAQLAEGYLNAPEQTAEQFFSDPFEAEVGARVYRSGDLARWRADGVLEFLGRSDRQLKLRGYRVEPGEIEATLLNDPAVAQAAVVLRRDAPGDPRLVAYVAGDAPPTDGPRLQSLLRDELPAYMVPAHVVVLDALPLTHSGKLARSALPPPEYGDGFAPYAAPRTATETTLTQLWATVLGLERVGIHDDFFTLGGHSLLATQLISRVRDAFGADVPLLELFAKPTVAEFAAVLPTAANRSAAAITRADRGRPLPLAFAQQRLWFLEQLEPGNAAYHVPLALELDTPLDPQCLQQALEALTTRHESLRTVFRGAGQQAEQRVLDSLQVPLVSSQLSADRGQREHELRRLTNQPFDLERGPLLRAHLLQINGGSGHILLLVTHHIVADGWSAEILLGELAALYSSVLAGHNPELAPLPLQYADFAVWQRDCLQGSALEEQMRFWRTALADTPPLLELPLDFPRPAEQSYRGGSVISVVPRALLDGLRTCAATRGCTLYMLLLAAFDLLLATYSGATEVVVGTPIAGRRRSELEGVVGYFSNTLAIPASLSGDPEFETLLGRVRQATLDAYAHQDLPFEKLVEELQPERSLSHTPIFQAMFVLQNTPASAPTFGTTVARSLGFETGIAKFDLLLEAAELPDGLRTGLQYNADLFKRGSIERMLEHLQSLLASIVANPAAPLSTLATFGTAERSPALQGPELKPQAARVTTRVEQQAAATPGRTAIEAAGLQLTYADVDQRATKLALALQQRDAGPGRRVGVCLERTALLPVAVLAIFKSGAVCVPLDPDCPRDRLQHMLNTAGVTLVVTETTLRDRLPAGIDVLLCTADRFTRPAATTTGRSAVRSELAGDGAYVVFTSGSTGRPKGVEFGHPCLNNLVQWQTGTPGLDAPARTLQFAPLTFDVSFQEIFTTWSQGGTLIMLDDAERRDFARLTERLIDAAVERLYLPAAALNPLAEIALPRVAELRLRDVVVAGEQLQVTPAVRALFRALPGARLHNHYGPSETHVVCAHTLDNTPDEWPLLPPIGLPVANTTLRVTDSAGEPVPVGVPGELLIAGTQVACGYVDDAELTAQRFVTHPDGTGGGRVYRSGDRVRLNAGGLLEYCGRADAQLKWRGYRIEPGEIEAALCALPAVAQAVVMVREDTPGQRRLVAYVGSAGDPPLPQELRLQLAVTLPDYMLPDPIIVLSELPLTPSGKLARRALPIPDSGAGSTAPRSALEHTMAKLVAAVLSIPQVGTDDDFFRLGGHSLLAASLVARIRDACGVQLTLKDVFRNPTPAALASRAADLQAAAALTAADGNLAGDDREQFEL